MRKERYVEVDIRVTFTTTMSVPKNIAHDHELVDKFVEQYGNTEETLSTADWETDVLNYWYEDEDGEIHRHI